MIGEQYTVFLRVYGFGPLHNVLRRLGSIMKVVIAPRFSPNHHPTATQVVLLLLVGASSGGETKRQDSGQATTSAAAAPPNTRLMFIATFFNNSTSASATAWLTGALALEADVRFKCGEAPNNDVGRSTEICLFEISVKKVTRPTRVNVACSRFQLEAEKERPMTLQRKRTSQ
jgi:hypothetical protein